MIPLSTLPKWFDDIDPDKMIEIKSLLPFAVSYDKLMKDVRDWFVVFPDKDVCINLRQFLEYPVLEFVKKNDEDIYTVSYIVFLGDYFRLVLNVENIVAPMMNQLARFSPTKWCYELRRIPAEARRKCPVLCGLLDKMNTMNYGDYSLFHFERMYRGMHLVYSDITDLYSSVNEMMPYITKLLKISDILAQEVLGAGKLDATKEREIKDAIRIIRRILIYMI